jgi:hypothetical protein
MRSSLFIVIVVLVATISASASYNNASNEVVGVRETIVMSGLNHVIGQILPVVLQEAKAAKIPDVHGKSHTPIGEFSYSITNIHIPVLQDHTFKVNTIQGHGLKVDVAGLRIEVHMNWHFRKTHWPHVSGSGSVEVKTSGATIDIKTAIGMAGGKPTIHCDHATVNLNQFSIHVHGGWSWLLNTLTHIFHNQIRHVVEQQVDKEICTMINHEGQKRLHSLKLVVSLGPNSEVDFSLTQHPHFGGDYFAVAEKGEFYRKGHHEEAPFPATPLPDLAGSGHFRIMASDYVANSAGYVYWKAGQLQHLLTEADLSTACPIKLTTEFFKSSVPALYAKFPNMKIRVEIVATASPITKITPSEIGVQWVGELRVFVLNGGESIKVATIGMELSTAGRAWMEVHVFHADVHYLHFAVSVKDSIIGPIDLSPLNWIFEYLCTKGIVPFVNILMSKGVEIPVIQGFHLRNPNISFQAGYIVVGTDLDYRH